MLNKRRKKAIGFLLALVMIVTQFPLTVWGLSDALKSSVVASDFNFDVEEGVASLTFKAGDGASNGQNMIAVITDNTDALASTLAPSDASSDYFDTTDVNMQLTTMELGLRQVKFNHIKN